MSKLCPCRRSKLKKLLSDIAWGGCHIPGNPDKYAEDDTVEVESILESDCVCEKKENERTPTAAPTGKCLHGCYLSDLCLYCEHDRKYSKYECEHGVVPQGTAETICSYCLEKYEQSQSPCEHKPNDEISFDTNMGGVTLWLCKCGLVTCRNPNQ